MSENQNLYEKVQAQIEAVRNFSPEILAIPSYITDNLKYELFPWQREALESLLIYENEKTGLKKFPTHLLLNMATGTGKTLLMAACILYYYKQGYRHFLFFVNQNNIVDKTENNFLDSTHVKYLFKEKIIIDNKLVKLHKVDTFSDNTNDIEIKFTTIQKLYNDIHIEKENQINLAELIKKDIVMLADEAHHLNVNTKNKKDNLNTDFKGEITGRASAVEIERKGWEHTVINLILNKNGQYKDNKNVLLEFTATVPDEEQVLKKYRDKLIYKFGLKEFLQAGYTKEINLISSTLNKKERILHALLFNWYREKIALKYYRFGNESLANFKPVILFRSKTIEESREDYEEFLKIVNNLKPGDFDFLQEIEKKINKRESFHERGKSRTRELINFIKKENISYSQIIEFIRYNFSEKNCLITNSKTNKKKTEETDEEQDKLLNSLEDKNNHIRAIFTVKRLTEGWDVLNLFDIVRLYQGQNTGKKTKKTPQATIEEKQLIGRGVRYYPFSYQDKPKNKRKFDDELTNELRVLEELYYYTYDEESRYISHIKAELRKDGYLKDSKVIKPLRLKNHFPEKDFFKNSILRCHEEWGNPKQKKKNLDVLKKGWAFIYKVKGLEISEEEIDLAGEKDKARLNLSYESLITIPVKFKDFDLHIINKAINIKAREEQSLFRFCHLKDELEIESVKDLLKEEFLGDFEIKIITVQGQSFADVSNKEKLYILLRFLDEFSSSFHNS